MIDMFYGFLVWIADHTIIMMGIGAAIALLLKVENKIPKRYERWLFIADGAFIVSSLLLGALKDHLDATWAQSIEIKIKDSRDVAENAITKMQTAVKNADAANAKAEAISKEFAVERARSAELEKRAKALEVSEENRSDAESPRGLLAARMGAMLKELASAPKLKVEIEFVSTERDAGDLAKQIATLLEAAGIEFRLNSFFSPDTPFGVKVSHGNDAAAGRLANSLAAAITIGGVKATATSGPEGSESVIIRVGVKTGN